MYEEFYGFTGKPFLIVPDPDYLYPSPKHERGTIIFIMMKERCASQSAGSLAAKRKTKLGALCASVRDYITPTSFEITENTENHKFFSAVGECTKSSEYHGSCVRLFFKTGLTTDRIYNRF